MNLSNLLKITRQYFWKLGFEEIDIPYLNPIIPNEPNIYPFSTTWTHANAKFFLPTSPELALKKHLADQKQSQRDPLRGCFAISHCFRDLETSGPHHSPEFLMLEWYEVGKTLDDIQNSTQKFISQFLTCQFSNLKLPVTNFDNEPDFNQFFLNQIEPTLPPDKAVFITGYPAYLSPLANSTNNIATRFELYINGIEIANACTENTSPTGLKPYLSPSILSYFTNIPNCSGIGIGIDRLLMLINNNSSINPWIT